MGVLDELISSHYHHRLCLESESETENENGNEESDLEPCIAYTQQLGREYIDLILDKSRWMFDVNKDLAIQVCERLSSVYLSQTCTRYL